MNFRGSLSSTFQISNSATQSPQAEIGGSPPHIKSQLASKPLVLNKLMCSACGMEHTYFDVQTPSTLTMPHVVSSVEIVDRGLLLNWISPNPDATSSVQRRPGIP
jgi:hypothetical protein